MVYLLPIVIVAYIRLFFLYRLVITAITAMVEQMTTIPITAPPTIQFVYFCSVKVLLHARVHEVLVFVLNDFSKCRTWELRMIL